MSSEEKIKVGYQYPTEFKAVGDEYRVMFESKTVGTVTNKGSSKIREVGDKIGGLDHTDAKLWERPDE